MANWQLTATTIICDISGTEVTITVRRDGRLTCTGQKVGTAPGAGSEKTSLCLAQECLQINEYRVKLAAEDSNE